MLCFGKDENLQFFLLFTVCVYLVLIHKVRIITNILTYSEDFRGPALHMEVSWTLWCVCVCVCVCSRASRRPCGRLTAAVFTGTTVKLRKRHDRKWPQ